MLDGFATVLPQGGDILVSEESATYRPEMEWLVRQLNTRFPERSWKVLPAENYQPQAGRDVYRFFELFDLPNLPGIGALMEAAGRGRAYCDAAVQALSRGEDVVRAFLAPAAARFLAARVGRQIFSAPATDHSLHLDPGPDSAAAACRHSAARNSRLEGCGAIQPEGARSVAQGERIFAVRLGEPRGRARGRSAPCGMAAANRGRADRISSASRRSCSVFIKAACSIIRIGIAETDELKTMRGRVRLCPYYFVEAGEGDAARGARDDLSGR